MLQSMAAQILRNKPPPVLLISVTRTIEATDCAAYGSQGILTSCARQVPRILAVGDAEALFDLGTLLLDLQSYREAAALYARVAALAPSAAAAHHQHGLALARAGNTSDALEAYGRAVALDGAPAVSLNTIGVLLSGMGRLDEALDYYSRAHAVDPGYKDAADNVAAVLRAGEHYRDLVAHHREAARAIEGNAPAGPGQVPLPPPIRDRLGCSPRGRARLR